MLIKNLYEGLLPAKLRLAGDLYARLGGSLRLDKEVQRLLARLIQAESALRDRMEAMGLPAFCARCAGRPTGGCCSAEIGHDAEVLLLLANFLLQDTAGLELHTQDCAFLGPRGCILRLKPVFCLQYNCAGILTGHAAPQLEKLAAATAGLLRQQGLLEELLLLRVKPALRDFSSLTA